MNTLQTTPAAPREEWTCPWWFSILPVLVLARVVVHYFWPAVDVWAGPAIVALIVVAACVMFGRWAFGKPVSRRSALFTALLVCAGLIGFAVGSVEKNASPAEHGNIWEPALLGPMK